MSLSVTFSEGQQVATISGPWQYDYGQTLEISGISGLPAEVPVHFAPENATQAVTMLGEYSNGVLTVVIPDAMFQQSGAFWAYLYWTNGTSGQTIKGVKINLSARPAPSDPASPQDLTSFNSLVNELNTLIASVMQTNDTATASKTAAANSATAAGISEQNALIYKNAAASSATEAGNSATAASVSETNAAASETNAAASATAAQSSLSDVNLKIKEKTGYGVYSGLVVTSQTTPNMTVSVAAGTIYMANGDRFTPAANMELAIAAADAANPRIDIVYVNLSGMISYLAGTAAASPSAPSVPTGGQKLAEITVAAGVTTITSNTIADKRRLNWSEVWIKPTLQNGATTDSANPVLYRKNQFGKVEFKGRVTVTNGNIVMSMPSGYRIASTRTVKNATVNSSSSYSTVEVLGYNIYASVGLIDFSNLGYYAEE